MLYDTYLDYLFQVCNKYLSGDNFVRLVLYPDKKEVPKEL